MLRPPPEHLQCLEKAFRGLGMRGLPGEDAPIAVHGPLAEVRTGSLKCRRSKVERHCPRLIRFKRLRLESIREIPNTPEKGLCGGGLAL